MTNLSHEAIDRRHPTDWRFATFGRCAHLVRESVSPSRNGDTPYIGLQHIGKGELSLLSHGLEGDVESVKTRFQYGDILFGKLRPYFRKVIRAPFDGMCSTDIWVVRAIEGVDQGFLYYIMASEPFVDFATAGSEGTRMPRAQWEHVSRYEVSFPSLSEQRAIAHVLGTLDDKIELNRRMGSTLEEMARELFKAWFVDFDPVRAKMEGHWRRGESFPGLPADLRYLFPDRLVGSELGDIPEGWLVGKLGQVMEVNPPRKIKRGQMATHVGMAALPTSGPHVTSWTRRAYTSGSRFTLADTLLARITPSLENGKTGFVDFLNGGEMGWGSTEFVVLRSKHPWPPTLAYLLARDPSFRDHAISNMTGTSGRQRVPAETLVDYRLVVPPDNVAVEFGRITQPWFELMTWINRESTTLATLRDTLLPRLVSGNVRVR